MTDKISSEESFNTDAIKVAAAYGLSIKDVQQNIEGGLEVLKNNAAIIDLATSGVICKVFGHWWIREACRGLEPPLTYHRVCRLCGKKQSGHHVGIQWED